MEGRTRRSKAPRSKAFIPASASAMRATMGAWACEGASPIPVTPSSVSTSTTVLVKPSSAP
jgi:hypothetical protein